MRPAVEPPPPLHGELVRRAAVSLGLAALPWLLARVPLPGARELVPEGRLASFEAVSLAALGITPWVTAFGLVELVALAVPRWRSLRFEGRQKLVVASMVLGLALAVVQALGVAWWLRSTGARYGLEVALVTTAALLVGVSALLVVAVALGSRYGLANGFSVLLGSASAIGVADAVGELRLVASSHEWSDGAFLAALGLFAAAVALTGRALRPRHGVPLPACGGVPLADASILLGLPQHLAGLGIVAPLAFAWFPGTERWELARAALLVGLGMAYSRAFNLPARVAAFTGRGVQAAARDLRRASWLSIGWMLGLAGLAWAAARTSVALPILDLAVVTAIGWDLVREWGFRRRFPGAVTAVSLQRSYAVDPVLADLQAAGIAACPRARSHRARLQFFGPFVPVAVLVPADRAVEARELAAARLARPRPVPRFVWLVGVLLLVQLGLVGLGIAVVW